MTSNDSFPPSLHTLQRRFAEMILQRGTPTGTVAASVAFASVPTGTDAEQRLGVYTHGYPARIHEALQDVYPAVAHILGERAFAVLADGFIASGKIAAHNLNAVGDTLPEFVATHPLSERLPFLPDLAQLERAVQRAFHATIVPPVDPTTVASLPEDRWPQARLRFQPGTAVVVSSWPILDLWHARETPRAEIDLQIEGRPQSVLVFRQGLDVHCEPAGDVEVRLLAQLLEGEPLGTVIEGLAAGDEGDIDVGAAFGRWMGAGLIVAVEA